MGEVQDKLNYLQDRVAASEAKITEASERASEALRAQHALALALREISVKHESCSANTAQRTSALEQAVFSGSMSLTSKVAVLEARSVVRANGQTALRSLEGTRITSRTQLAVAWIGVVSAIVMSLVSLVASLLTKGAP